MFDLSFLGDIFGGGGGGDFGGGGGGWDLWDDWGGFGGGGGDAGGGGGFDFFDPEGGWGAGGWGEGGGEGILGDLGNVSGEGANAFDLAGGVTGFGGPDVPDVTGGVSGGGGGSGWLNDLTDWIEKHPQTSQFGMQGATKALSMLQGGGKGGYPPDLLAKLNQNTQPDLMQQTPGVRNPASETNEPSEAEMMSFRQRLLDRQQRVPGASSDFSAMEEGMPMDKFQQMVARMKRMGY